MESPRGSLYQEVMATESVVWSTSSSRAGAMKSPQVHVNESRKAVVSTGRDNGRKIVAKMRTQPHPSMIAASSRSRGIAAKNCRNRNTRKGEAARPHKTHGQYVLTSPIRENST